MSHLIVHLYSEHEFINHNSPNCGLEQRLDDGPPLRIIGWGNTMIKWSMQYCNGVLQFQHTTNGALSGC